MPPILAHVCSVTEPSAIVEFVRSLNKEDIDVAVDRADRSRQRPRQLGATYTPVGEVVIVESETMKESPMPAYTRVTTAKTLSDDARADLACLSWAMPPWPCRSPNRRRWLPEMRCARALPTNQLMPAASSRSVPAATPLWVDLPERMSGRTPSTARTSGTPSIIMSPDP